MTRLALLLTLLLALAVPAVAKEKSAEPAAARESRRGMFSSAERNLIRSWLLEAERREATGHPASGLPAGLQKKAASGKPLPPGWQRKLNRGARLDQEWYGYGVELPDDLLRRLPPPPPGSEIVRIADQIVRLDAATRIILDVFGLGVD